MAAPILQVLSLAAGGQHFIPGGGRHALRRVWPLVSLAFFLNRDHLRPFRVQLNNGELDGKPVGSDLTDNPLADEW